MNNIETNRIFPAESPCLYRSSGILKEDVLKRISLAREGFLARNMIWDETGCRPVFSNVIWPKLKREASQWDHGDSTARALFCWMKISQWDKLTAEEQTVYDGLRRHLFSIFHPQNSVVFVPENSDPENGDYYFHMWDQGRVLDYLVLDVEMNGAKAKESLERAILLTKGVTSLAKLKKTLGGSSYLHWESDIYWNNGTILPKDRYFGNYNWGDFCIASSQLLGPIARLAKITRDAYMIEVAEQVGNAFLVGCENRRNSTTPTFDSDGRFYGHFHGSAAGLLGLCDLADLYLQLDRPEEAQRLRNRALKSYDWLMGRGASNANPVSSCGYAPETLAPAKCHASEICSTTDALRLAIRLAEYVENNLLECDATLLWDDVERSVLNEIFLCQINNPSKYLSKDSSVEEKEEIQLLKGAWASCRSFLSDHLLYQCNDQASLYLPGAKNDSQKHWEANLAPGGCCSFHGVCALLSILEVFSRKDTSSAVPVFTFRYLDGYSDANLELTFKGNDQWKWQAKEKCVVRIYQSYSSEYHFNKVPLCWNKNSFEFHLEKGETVECGIQRKQVIRRETAGTWNWPPVFSNYSEKEFIETEITFEGNRVVKMSPDGFMFPFLQPL